MLQNVPFPVRVKVFGDLLLHCREGLFQLGRTEIRVRRDSVFEDAFRSVSQFSAEQLKCPFLVRFANGSGELESGYGAGVYREFILELCKQGFAPEHGLFAVTPTNELYPNPMSFCATGGDPQHLEKFHFLGAMLGRALMDGVLVDVPLAQYFRNALLGRRNTFTNVCGFDRDLFTQMNQLRRMEDVESLDLDFTVTIDRLGVATTIPLIPNGEQIRVSKKNLVLYLEVFADFKLNRENGPQLRAFQRGLHQVVDPSWLKIFDSNELMLLFRGDESHCGLDVEDWRRNTVYVTHHNKAEEGGADAPVVEYFWTVVQMMTPEQQRGLLKFATSMSRAPLLGFKHMNPRFCIAVVDVDPSNLPTAATCFCQIKLPPYRDVEETKRKLITAISNCTTFELT
jgi:hypothetical protein